MLKRIFLCLLSVVFAAFCLTSCDTMGSVNELLTAPRSGGELYDIQQALYSYAGRSVKLHYPRSGENRTPFIRYDIDGDKVKEAVALYSASNADGVNEIHINIIDKSGDKWSSVCDTATGASAIDKVEIAPLSAHGVPVIAVGAELFSSTANQLSLFTYADGRLYTRMKENYTRFILCDLAQTGFKQLVLINVNSTERAAKAQVFEVGDDHTTMLGNTVIDGNVSSITACTPATLDDGRQALFIDSVKSASSAITDLIYFEGEKLINPFYDPTLGETRATLRYNTLVCTDINSDGKMDIPFAEAFNGYENASLDEKLYFTRWRSFDGNSYTDSLIGDFGYENGYYFALPQSWVGKVTLIYDKSNSMHSYRLWDSQLSTASSEILRIRRYSAAEFDQLKKDNLVELDRNDNVVWAARLIMNEGKYALDGDAAKKCFGKL